jgi:uncharacterized membrane protein
MNHRRQPLLDERVDEIISAILRVGVSLAALLVLVGGIYYLIRHGSEIPNYRTFHGQPRQLRTIPGIIDFAAHSHSRGIIELGLLLLIATPIARVIFSVLAFAKQRDRLYVVVTSIVLGVLVYNLVVGFR